MEIPFEVLLGLVITGVLIVAILLSGEGTTKLQYQAVRDAADTLGLELLEAPGPETVARTKARWEGTSVDVEIEAVAQGKCNTTPVSIHIELRSDDEMVKPYLMCQAVLAAPALSNLALAPEGLGEKIDKHFFNGRDLEVGDAELDQAFIIDGPDPEFITALLTTESVKKALLTARERVPDFTVSDGRVVVDRDIFGQELKAVAISKIIEALAEVAAAFDREISHRDDPQPPSPRVG
jgi:hypothetical protein